MFGKTLKRIANLVPEHANSTYVAQVLATAGLASPIIGYALPQSNLWLPQPYPLIAQAGIGIVAVGLETLLLAKLAVKNKWGTPNPSKISKKLEVSLGGMTFDEKALFTNLIAFGSIGSGKTAAVIYPILDTISGIYNSEDPTLPNAKWGGFVLDVKGDFHEAVIYVMQKHGRDPLKDLVVIRPDNDYYVLEFEETTTGEHFLVSCMGGTSMQECDLVLAKADGPSDVVVADPAYKKAIRLPNGDLEALSSFVFSDRGTFRRPEVHKLLTQLEFDVKGLSVRWLGWREDKTGRLVRVLHTEEKKPIYAKDAGGNQISTNKPNRLRYIGVHSINNGLTYNLISKTAASTEAAGRIMAVAEVTGNSFGNDNAYWSNASEKHIAACIELFRQVEGPMGLECSVNEIQKFTTNEPYLTSFVSKLKNVIKNKQELGASSYEILLLRNLDDYFTGEWMKHDPKTKGNIMSCVTNLFGDVTRNEQLIKTFCQPSKFSFEGCLNDGKIYTLVLSAYPNAQMLIGTCMKLDFQQVVLKRTQAAPVNKQRFLMFLADEYQYFITTSGGGKTGGDEKFLSVARQSRIFNLIATQAKTSLLAVQKDENKIDAFIQCFGSRVFLQNLDEKTNKLAEQTCGQFWNEKEDHSGADLKISSAFSEGKSGSVTRRQEKMNRFEASHFTQMPPFEAVLFNKEKPTGHKNVKANLKETARFWDKKMLSSAANDYYQAYIENRAYQLGLQHMFDLKDNIKKTDPSELKHRASGILRSWRDGVPVGLVLPSDDTQQASTTAAADDVQNPEEPISEPQENALDGMMQELQTLPKLSLLKEYTTKQPSYHSDLEASRASDPFYSREATEVVVTPKPEDVSSIPQSSDTFEENLDKSLKELALEPQGTPTNRMLSNMTNVPDLNGNPKLMAQLTTIPDLDADGNIVEDQKY